CAVYAHVKLQSGPRRVVFRSLCSHCMKHERADPGSASAPWLPLLLRSRRTRFDRAQLALALELRPVYAVQLHEPHRHVECLLVRLQIEDRVAADQLLRFRERSVDHTELAIA